MLSNDPNINFILMSTTLNTLLRVRSFLKVFFKMTFSTRSTLEVDEFFMYTCSPSTSLYMETIIFSVHTFQVMLVSTHHCSRYFKKIIRLTSKTITTKCSFFRFIKEVINLINIGFNNHFFSWVTLLSLILFIIICSIITISL